MPDREELLVAREDELHRPPGGARERRDVRLEVKVAFRAEAAAEQRDDDADVRLRDTERVCDPAARDVGHLRRRPDRHPVSLPLGHDRPRLDRDALHRIGDVPSLHHDVRPGERGVDVPLGDRGEPEHVLVPAHRLVALVRLPVGVDARRVVGERGREVGQHGERLELDHDERGRRSRDLGGVAATPATMSPSKRTVSRAKSRRSFTMPP